MIYFVQGERSGLIKIGYSASIKRRLGALHVGSPEQLRVLALMPGTKDDESALHERFASARSHGEWFHPHGALVRFIDGLTVVHGENPAEAHFVRRRRRRADTATRSRLDALQLAADKAGMTPREYLLSVALPAIEHAHPSDRTSTFHTPAADGGRGA